MNVLKTALEGALIVETERFSDQRGSFFESWHKERYAQLGIGRDFVQDNISCSTRGVLRGLHFQNPKPQAKLVQVLQGEVLDVAVDIRVGSPTFGKWLGTILSHENNRQVYLPEGFAHGFVVLSESAVFAYKCSDFYCRECERTILWNDPDIGVEWTIVKPILSQKDARGVFLRAMPPEHLPQYKMKAK